jgi:hypothetical protein
METLQLNHGDGSHDEQHQRNDGFDRILALHALLDGASDRDRVTGRQSPGELGHLLRELSRNEASRERPTGAVSQLLNGDAETFARTKKTIQHQAKRARGLNPAIASYWFRCAVQYPEQRSPAARPFQIPRPESSVSLPEPDAYLS